ncbi:MAG: substrate-binding domain-containing protein [Thermoguttaceae bacterium]|jgi:ABC-type sugar transport system substrate-binding protein
MKRCGTRWKTAALLLTAALAIPGCRPAPPEHKEIVIGLTVPSLSHPFFVCIKKHIEDEARKLGVKVLATDAEDVAAKQMAIVEDFIAQGVDGVVMAPIGAEVLVPAVESLNRAGIPVATVDRKVAGGDVLVHVGADNVEGGRIAARYIVEKLGGKGAVIELEGTPGASPAVDRKTGFEEVLAASQVRLLASQTAEFYRAKGQSVMENLLQVHHDFQALYAANDEMVLGALEALAARGVPPGQVVTVGYDVIPDAARAIEEGRLTASIEQFPGQQARKALGLLVAQIRDGKPPPAKEIYLTPLAIDKHNLDKAEVKD